ncbi:MAG: hypothetical protein ACJ75R_02720 [Solirubrobacterales bacterium]
MLAALASAALIAAGSLAIGQAILFACGGREWTWSSAPVGLAAILTASGIAAGIGARGTVIWIVLGVLVVAAVLFVGGTRGGGHGGPSPALLAAAVAALAAAIPFIAAGRIGILGVGLVNDDMASHLLLADWIDERFVPDPALVHQGYPLAPHALVAGLSALLGATSIDVFAGLMLAIPAMTALVVYGILDGLRPVARTLASALVALPYLAAAYLAQEAFKEPIIALFILGFALLLPRVKDWRTAIPLGVLGAGTVYVYSFPGLAWLAGTAIVWGLARALTARRPPRVRPILIAAAVGVAVTVVLILPEAGRIADFADFRALHPGHANEGGLGNLPGQLSPLEALGLWPTSDFRVSAAAASAPAVIFYAAGAVGLLALALAAPGWLRRYGWAIPAALLAAAFLDLLARALGTVYTSAKALALAAPLIALVILGGLLASDRRVVRLLAVGFGVAAAASSFLILRQAPVAPETHMDELAHMRPLVDGHKLLFLGRDNFVLYELRGSKPFTAVQNFYDKYFVEPNRGLEDVFEKFDFDSVDAATLERFRYVLTTRAAYASGPPPGYRVVHTTPSYVLWRRAGPVGNRFPAEHGPTPGRVVGCSEGQRPSGRAAIFDAKPVRVDPSRWSSETVHDGSPATIELTLPAGDWLISLAYDATRPLALTADGTEFAELPANLDFRGPGPYWPAGEIDVDRPTEVTVEAAVEQPPLAGRLLGASSVAHLGALAASPATTGYVDAQRPLPGTGERLRPAADACDAYVDWLEKGQR